MDFYITRGSENPQNGYNNNECGSFTVIDNKTEKTLVEGTLYYDGKGLTTNYLPSGVYFFKVKTTNGQTSRFGLRRIVKKSGDGYIVTLKYESVTGALQNHPFLKETLGSAPGSIGRYADTTPDAYTEKELLQALRDSDPEAAVYGFGNRRQYIAAHAGLNPSKTKYAKPKGTSSINIRGRGIATANKVGELQPGQTLPVVDEYNGWCQVCIADNKFGWVSLSVVTLTNTQAAHVASTPQETVCPLVGFWSGMPGGGWAELAVGIRADKKKGNDYQMPNLACNGSISMTDEDFIKEKNFSLIFNRTISADCYEFTVIQMLGKQQKSGKVQIKRVGSKIVITGLDAWTKQQPFHNKTIEVSNL